MSVKVHGFLSSLRSVWSDVMPLSRGVSFTTQDFLEDRVSELEQENRRLREQLAHLQGWPAGVHDRVDRTACRI